MFSFKRFYEQFKILVYQNFNRHGVFLLIYVLYLVFVHFKYFNTSGNSADYPFESFGFIISLAGIFFSIDVFGKLRTSTGSGITYMMTPATIFEKFFSALIYSTIVVFIVFFITYLFVNFVAITTGNIIQTTHLPYYFPDLHKIWSVLSDMLFFQSLYFLGSVFFRKNPFGKTTAVIAGFIVIVSLISAFILKHSIQGSNEFFHNNFTFNFNGSMDDYTINGVPMDIFFENVKNVIIVCAYILPVACWTASYFRLKKLEI
jgi:hypothetical protein